MGMSPQAGKALVGGLLHPVRHQLHKRGEAHPESVPPRCRILARRHGRTEAPFPCRQAVLQARRRRGGGQPRVECSGGGREVAPSLLPLNDEVVRIQWEADSHEVSGEGLGHVLLVGRLQSKSGSCSGRDIDHQLLR